MQKLLTAKPFSSISQLTAKTGLIAKEEAK
jgi:hypothetical protein